MKKLKENRVLSFIIITFVYILATFVGVLTYNHLNLDVWLNLLIADTAATIVCFVFSLIFNNASVYDPYWSVQPPVIVGAFIFTLGGGAAAWLLFSAILFWGIRLTANWAYTFRGLTEQDWRYTMLKEKTGIFYPLINFFGIHYVPTLVVYFCTLPAVYVCVYGGALTPLSVFFTITAFLSAILQGVSDIYMHKYRRHKDTPFIRSGPWQYSRHPNYLGEILMWWSIGLGAVFSLGGSYYLLIGALLNTALFLFVSLPMAEARQSKKPGFADYKSETRLLLPIPKRAHQSGERTKQA